jgi:hypothetical protein
MSTDNVIVQVWKHGTKGNNIEFANIKLLEKHEPNTFAKIEWKEGYVCQDHDYEYRVGLSRYGLWLSRKPLGQIQTQVEDKPPSRPPMMTEQQTKQEQSTVSVNKDYEIAELKKRVLSLENWIQKFKESAMMNL